MLDRSGDNKSNKRMSEKHIMRTNRLPLFEWASQPKHGQCRQRYVERLKNLCLFLLFCIALSPAVTAQSTAAVSMTAKRHGDLRYSISFEGLESDFEMLTNPNSQ